ncbi:MAG TPA: type II toxin-antitoxin system VapC family toxin [Roseiflexaceae bacterium]|nr:type II toxin-antitoxin system VapC family toxin [Roseiflexaceae bacterium]
MSDYYADTSVLVKRHVRESGTDWFTAVADPATGNTILTALVSMVEVISALQRRVREGVLDVGDAARLSSDFQALCVREYRLIALTTPVIERACQLLVRHPLRAYDAVQLAAALIARDALVTAGAAAMTFLSADWRLLNAAAAEGLLFIDPSTFP